MIDLIPSFANHCKLTAKLTCESTVDCGAKCRYPARNLAISNEVTGKVIIDLAGFWVIIDLTGKIANDVNRKGINEEGGNLYFLIIDDVAGKFKLLLTWNGAFDAMIWNNLEQLLYFCRVPLGTQ